MEDKEENKDGHVWLNKDQIITKFWNDEVLKNKMEWLLKKFQCYPQTGIIDDCIAATFLELSKMDKDKIETLYNGKMKNTFQGYILQMFKMVSIYTSNGNYKSSVVSNIKYYGSSINSDASINPTENGYDEFDDGFCDVIISKEDDPNSVNNLFDSIIEKLTEDEIRTMNLIIDKKETKGRYTSVVAEKVKRLKEDIKKYAAEHDDSYNYVNKEKKEYKTDAEIQEEINKLNNRNDR
jgi:hypothetical protein